MEPGGGCREPGGGEIGAGGESPGRDQDAPPPPRPAPRGSESPGAGRSFGSCPAPWQRPPASERPSCCCCWRPPRRAGGNEGGALGLCKCLRLTSPPSRLQDLADKVRGHQACSQHLVRFELPRGQICGLASANWVTELRRLWEKKEAGRIDARQGRGGLAPNPTSTPPPPNAHPPMPSTARPLEPHEPTDGPPEPHGPTARPPEPHEPTDGPPEPHGPTARPPEPHELTDGPPEPHGPTDRPTDEALTTDPVGGPGLAPWQGEGAGDGAPTGQPRPYLPAVLVLLGITLLLVGALTYVLCRRSRRPPRGPGPPHRDPGIGTPYYPCELG